MRRLLALLLSALTLGCPLLCGAVEVGCQAHRVGHDACGDHQESDDGDPAPAHEPCEQCFCGGALKADQDQLDLASWVILAAELPPILGDCIACGPIRRPIPALAGPGGASARAWLQSFQI